ncbi:hypothetical protein ABIA32_005161 [Streptacidiphilus sp. MAP12-20]|uniref:hypothetical protein n=1 Tax=Streptacidiphilus sp. MAP12-20 TaxID=3156299 RepID=UPI003515CBD2
MKTPQRSFRPAGAAVLTAALSLGSVAIGGDAYANANAHRHSGAAHAIDWAHPIPFTAANVTQNADGSFTVSWASDAANALSGVQVYAGPTP